MCVPILLILLYMCPHNAICVLTLLFMRADMYTGRDCLVLDSGAEDALLDDLEIQTAGCVCMCFREREKER